MNGLRRKEDCMAIRIIKDSNKKRPFLHYKSYEEALEAGLQEALKLI